MNTTPVSVDGKAGFFTAAKERASRMRQSAKAQLCMMDARMRLLTAKPEEGAATAEYAAVTVAGIGLGGLLIAILKSEVVRKLIADLIKAVFSLITDQIQA